MKKMELAAEIEDMKEVIIGVGSAVLQLQMQMQELQKEAEDHRNQPQKFGELQAEDYYMVEGITWIHVNGVRLMIEANDRAVHVTAFDDEIEDAEVALGQMMVCPQ